MKIPKKFEGGSIEFRPASEMFEDDDWMPEEYPCVVGQPTALTKSGTPYTTYAVGVRLSDDIAEDVAKRFLARAANRQLVEASKSGTLVVRCFPYCDSYIDDRGEECVRVSMRYAIE